eukprot:3047458-Rhodomonas_salina.2
MSTSNPSRYSSTTKVLMRSCAEDRRCSLTERGGESERCCEVSLTRSPPAPTTTSCVWRQASS